MTTKLQAPKGGCYSQINGDWYDGGRFLPETCLPKGTIKLVKKVAKVQGNIAKLEVKKSFTGYSVFATYTTNLNSFKVVFSGASQDEANSFAKALIEEKSEQYKADGLAPHTTNLILL